jgi:hypothetical protein
VGGERTVDLGAVELFNVSEDANLFVFDEVNGHTLASEATRSADSVNVKLSVVG